MTATTMMTEAGVAGETMDTMTTTAVATEAATEAGPPLPTTAGGGVDTTGPDPAPTLHVDIRR